ncbi:shieldin complex subunit 1 isoform X3 [Balaenoptera musculus]|uniref:Shieldin complex subunit 1 isoform X3 n=1 Tax=Balaenoptera musculus TaxID=9771 RepID=A0A8B8VCT0_BALMU|nr:shieldin complex subunit 1 isoform X3 [Balaenoptera musculus]
MSTTACDWVSSNERGLARTMATQEATPGSQSEESNALDLPSACDVRDYVLQRPSQEANSEAFSSEEALSIPCSSDMDPDLRPRTPSQDLQTPSALQVTSSGKSL